MARGVKNTGRENRIEEEQTAKIFHRRTSSPVAIGPPIFGLFLPFGHIVIGIRKIKFIIKIISFNHNKLFLGGQGKQGLIRNAKMNKMFA